MSFAQRGRNNQAIETSNLFGALLDDDKKKKKKEKKQKEPEPLKSLSPMPNATMSWADCADSDEDMFGNSPANWGDEEMDVKAAAADEPEEGDEEEPEEEEEEPEEEEEEDDSLAMLSSSKKVEKTEERQLSKKEMKRLEMEELDRALEELGMNQEAAPAPQQAEPAAQQAAEASAGEGNKRSRKRGGKKKAASTEIETTPAGVSTLNPELKDAVNESGALDPDAVAKLVAAKHGQKKKSSGSSGASAAAKEAAARKERAKKDKKKNKNNYNQQPTR